LAGKSEAVGCWKANRSKAQDGYAVTLTPPVPGALVVEVVLVPLAALELGNAC